MLLVGSKEDNVKVTAGGDTNIKGGVIAGQTVTANVGGNLKVSSGCKVVKVGGFYRAVKKR